MMSHHLSASVMRLISAACTAAAAVVIVAVVAGVTDHMEFVALLALLAVATEVFDFQPFPNTRISVTMALLIAAATLSGLTGVVVLALAASAADFASHRKAAEKAIFNFAALILSGAAYAGIMEVFASDTSDWAATIWPALIGTLAAYAVNSSLVALAISLDGGEKALGVWQECFTWVLPYYLAMGAIGASVAVGYRHWGIEAMGLGTALCLPAWLALRLHVMRLKAAASSPLS